MKMSRSRQHPSILAWRADSDAAMQRHDVSVFGRRCWFCTSTREHYSRKGKEEGWLFVSNIREDSYTGSFPIIVLLSSYIHSRFFHDDAWCRRHAKKHCK